MSVIDLLGLGDHECIAIVGAGGKTTLVHAIGREAEGSDRRVILTTTTHMSPDQIGEPVVWSADPSTIEAALVPGRPLAVATRDLGHKVSGIEPADADRIFSETSVDWLVIEADGARRRPFKAPADHEPAVPSSATTVVVVAGIDALGHPPEEVAHRPEIVALFTGAAPTEPLTIDHMAAVLLHESGGLKGIPPTARVVMAVSKVGERHLDSAQELAEILRSHPLVDRAVLLAATTG